MSNSFYYFLIFFASGFFGAFIRWILFKRDKSYKDVLFEQFYMNCWIGVLILSVIMIIYVNWIE
jgi:fluoride ion exporter CrcB/FEX